MLRDRDVYILIEVGEIWNDPPVVIVVYIWDSQNFFEFDFKAINEAERVNTDSNQWINEVVVVEKLDSVLLIINFELLSGYHLFKHI